MSTLRSSCALVALVAAAGAATAGPLVGTSNQNVFGSGYFARTFTVRTDLQPTGGPDLQPEGMVFFNGTLYVSGDSATTETNGYLAAYGGGDLTSTATAIGQFATSGRLVGPEGLAVNTRGTGFGSFSGAAPTFIAVDNVGGAVGRAVVALDTATTTVTVGQGVVSGVTNSFLNADDVAFVPGASAAQDRIAFLLDTGAAPSGGGTTPSVAFYSPNAPFVTGTTYNELSRFAVPAGAKGLLFLSAADAALINPLATTDALLVSLSPVDGTNFLAMFDLAGNQIGAQSALTGFTAIEALAWDAVGKRLFLGDEGGRTVSTILVPAPGAAALVGLAALAAARRRRSR